MYYLDSVIFSDYYYRNGTVGKKALFTTYNDPKNSTSARLYGQEISFHTLCDSRMVLVNMLSLQAPCLCTKKFNTVGPFIHTCRETTGYQNKKVPFSFEWI